MATVTVQIMNKGIETIKEKNEVCVTQLRKVTETGVAESTKNIKVNFIKESMSSDTGIVTHENNSIVSNLENEKENSIQHSKFIQMKLSKYNSVVERKEILHKEINKILINKELLMETEVENNFIDANLSSLHEKETKQNFNENNNSVSNYIMTESHNIINKDENLFSSTTIQINQIPIDIFDSKNVSELTEKQIQNKNQIIKSDLTEGSHFHSFFINSNCTTSTETQTINNKSDDESNSKSSSKSSNESSPDKESKTQSNFQNSQSVECNFIESSNSQSSLVSSNCTLSIKSQNIIDKSDEHNSRSSCKSSKESSPKKQSQGNDSIKKIENNENNLIEYNDSCTAILNENSDLINIKWNNKNNSNCNFKLSTDVSAPEIEIQKKIDQTKKYFTIVDSDSEDEITSQNKDNEKLDSMNKTASENISSNSIRKLKNKNKKKVIDSDSDESVTSSEIFGNRKIIEKECYNLNNKSNNISNLIDSDSESDNDNQSKSGLHDFSNEINNDIKKSKVKRNSEKKRKGFARASKESAMQQIHSETQRLIRESEISLPYHRPKQRTLQEFLSRRKITSKIPKNLTCAEKVKMFPEMISKVVEEKEKEAEIFYKSSDSDEDEQSNQIMEGVQTNIKNENKDEIQNKNKINMSEMQTLTQDKIEESNNKLDSLQQRSLDSGVSRKLFMEDINDINKIENIQESQKHINREENLNQNSLEVFKKRHEDVEICLKESNITQKLFMNNNSYLNMDIDTNNDGSMLKEKLKENSKILEDKENMNLLDNLIILENKSEEIILNISESKLRNSNNKNLIESSEIDYTLPTKNQENITMLKMLFTNDNELERSNKTTVIPVINKENIENKIINTEELENPMLGLNNNKIENHNILNIDFSLPFYLDESSKKSSIKEKILANVSNLKPMIKGSPGSIIDFANSGQMKEGVTHLLDRFARHSAIIKPKLEEMSEVKIIRTEGVNDDIKIIEEVLPFKKTVVDDEEKRESKPGEKLKRLREDLRRKIATIRNEEWKQKEECEKEDEEELWHKKDDFYADLPDEEELLEDEETSESEPEENDVLIIDKQKPRCSFGDEEAEESDNEYIEDIGTNEDFKEENNITSDSNDVKDDNENDEEEENEDVYDNHEEEDDDEEEEDDDDSEENENNKEQKYGTEEKSFNKPRKLKRIIKPFEDDSNHSVSSLSNDANARLSFDRTKTDEDMFASQTSNSYASEDIETYTIPPFQRQRCGSDSRSQTCKTPLPKPNNILSMISPVAQLTALNASLDSAKKSASKTNNIHFVQTDNSRSEGNTPAENRAKNCNLEKMISLPKKLFEDPPESMNDDVVVDIYAKKFTETQNSEQILNNKQNEVTDSQIMELCSGAFLSQPVDLKKLESADSNLQLCEETSQDFTLTLDEEENDNFMDISVKMSSSMKKSDESMFSGDSKSPVKPSNFSGGVSTIKNPMEAWLKRANEKSAVIQVQQQKRDEITDSQLMNLCSGSFTSQTIDLKELEKNETSHNQNKILQSFELTQDNNSENVNKENSDICKKQKKLNSSSEQIIADVQKELETPWTAYMIVSSDDEDENKVKKKKFKKKGLKKKKVQKLKLSDDEDDKSSEFSDSEDIEINEEDEEKYVDYDSDENEIVVVHKKEIKKVAKKFLENEAELTESEWDSADEDEQDMDKLEYEEGDREEIDEHKVKKQLDKFHVKQMLDEDQREVKMLQELLFDDGDLFGDGAGRERKFKWKNIDNFTEDDFKPTMDDDDGVDDEIDTASEVEMRKIRYAQQKFLEEKEKNLVEDADKDFNKGELLELGLKVVSVRSSTKLSSENSNINNSHSNSNKNFLMLNGVSSVSKTLASSNSFSLTSMRGSFLSRGDATLIRIAQNLPEKNKQIINPSRNKKFVFEHLSPSVTKMTEEDTEQEVDNTPDRHKKKARKRKIILSQTPKTTKKLKVDDRTGKKLF